MSYKTFQIELTDLCNHDCYYCYKKQDIQTSKFFPLDKVEYIYNEIQKIDCFKNIRLTGGEPFLAIGVIDKFIDLYCKNHTDTVIEMSTNLTLETNKLKEILDKLALHNTEIKFLISLQSYDINMYENITNTKNTFKTLIQNLHLISKYTNVHPVIHLIVSKTNIPNMNELKKTLMFIRSTGCKVIRINSLKQTKGLIDYSNTIFNRKEMLDLIAYAFSLQEELDIHVLISYQSCLPCDLTDKEFDKYKDLLKLIYEKYSYDCKAGENVFSIDMLGEIKPCAIVSKKYCEGTVFEDSLQHILDTKFEVFKKVKTPQRCLDCYMYKQYCNGGCKLTEFKMQGGQI